MQRKLTESDTGYNLTYWDQAVICPRRLPTLFYADDIVLPADRTKNLQRLLDISSEEAQTIGLHFNPAKSTSTVMASQEDPMQYTESRLMPQGNSIEWTNTYENLGVTLSAAPQNTHHYESEL
ncbi:hypothetical protein MRX96_011069 [Rhipicephalus microplus]